MRQTGASSKVTAQDIRHLTPRARVRVHTSRPPVFTTLNRSCSGPAIGRLGWNVRCRSAPTTRRQNNLSITVQDIHIADDGIVVTVLGGGGIADLIVIG